MPTKTVPKSRAKAASPPPSTVVANSLPLATTVPAAASAPSIATSTPLTTGLLRAKAKPSRTLLTTDGADAARGPSDRRGISEIRATCTAANRKVAAST